MRYHLAMLTIGQLARRVGLRPSALRYYEAEGLLRPSDRTEAGYRLYAPESADTVRLIQPEIKGVVKERTVGDDDRIKVRVEWTEPSGETTSRWFHEDELEAAE